MDEQVLNNVVETVQEAPVSADEMRNYATERKAEIAKAREAESKIADGVHEDTESTASEDTESTKIKPWEEDKEIEIDESKQETQVPVKALIKQRKEAQEAKRALAEMRELAENSRLELAKYKEREAQVKQIDVDVELEKFSLKTLKSMTFNSWEEYEKTAEEFESKRAELLKEKSLVEFEKRNAESIRVAEQKKQAEAVEKANQAIIAEFNTKVDIATKSDPEVGEAVNHFRKVAIKLSDAVLGSILEEDNSPALIYEILTDKQNIDIVFGGDQLKAVKHIARLAAKLDPFEAKKSTSDDMPEVLAKKSASIPKSVTGRTTTVSKAADYDNDDMKTFLAKRRAEEKNKRR